MRAIKPDEVPQTFEGARTLEQRPDIENAIALYERLLKDLPSSLKIIGRLIINYRKLKWYKKEVALIDRAIKIHEKLYLPKKNKSSVTAISNKLNKLLGHTDKKGKSILIPDEVLKLQKRKINLYNKYL